MASDHTCDILAPLPSRPCGVRCRCGWETEIPWQGTADATMALARLAMHEHWSHPDLASAAFSDLILAAERGLTTREGLRDTPRRAAKAWAELTSGYGPCPELRTFDADGSDGIVTQRGVTFHSLCEHHCLPFFGTVSFAYIPSNRILGLSKFTRLTRHFSRRLQTQERLTMQMADHLQEILDPQGTLVVTHASHLCMSMRGVSQLGATTSVSEARGVLRDSAQSKAEAMELLR